MEVLGEIGGARSACERVRAGRGRGWRRLYEQIERAAATDAPVILQGEPGSGKSLIARAIHEASPRAQGRFASLDASAPPASGLAPALVEALVQSEGGTLVLENVEALDPASWAVLLRAVDERVVERLGVARRVDRRIVATTRRDVAFEPRASGLRDLAQRPGVRVLALAPLRERRASIPRLARALVAELERASGSSVRRELSPATVEVLVRHEWPGNVRELADALRSALAAGAEARTLEPEHVPAEIRRATSPESVTIPIGTTLEEAERAVVERTIASTRGNKKEAARLLGISRSALYAKLERFGLAG